jgi:solute carrier family 25 2-oxodicarboxylate transporter 21
LRRRAPELPFYATFTAGAIAGISEILTFYPLGEYTAFSLFHVLKLSCRCRTCYLWTRWSHEHRSRILAQVKTRLQLDVGKSKHGLVGTFKDIVATEGCVSSLGPSMIR